MLKKIKLNFIGIGVKDFNQPCVKVVILLVTLLLTGCQEVLYEKLNQQEANEMLALLLGNGLPATKEVESSGMVTLFVDSGDFSRAIQLLHQHGYPRSRQMTFEELFPSGQLVTSPSQEHAKLVFFKEQQLENMFNQIDGVISSRVNIATCLSAESCPNGEQPTASIFIKHSPEMNLSQYQNEIRSLVRHSIQHIDYQDISVILFPAKYRYIEALTTESDIEPSGNAASLDVRLKYDLKDTFEWIEKNNQLLFAILIALACIVGSGAFFMFKRLQKR